MTNEPETPEMQAALPPQSSLTQVVDLDMKSGAFPASGALLTFAWDHPAASDTTPFIARWDPQNMTWVPLASETSSDRSTVSAKLEHFSTYGLFDLLSNLIGKLVGVRTSRPECDAKPPVWDDSQSTQFYDDVNGPVLWCATTDPANPDDLEIKLKLNRGAAASITTAIKPIWTHSDLWESFTPSTWATMGFSGPESLISNPDSYFLQPAGEFDFRFSKSDLLTYWSVNKNRPLIEVSTTVPDVLAGLLFTAASDNLPGGSALFLTTASMAISQCASSLVAAGGDLTLTKASAASVFSRSAVLMGVLASCLSDQREFTVQTAARFSATYNTATDFKTIADDAGKAAKKVMVIAEIYAAVQALAPVADAATDLLLDPITRQFIFMPTDEALKEHAGPSPSDLKSVVAPAMCQRPMGKLVNGQLPLPGTPNGSAGFTKLYENKDGTPFRAVGDASTGTQGLTALVFGCSIGGVAWPATVAVYDAHLQLIASFALGDIDHKEHSDVHSISFENSALRVNWYTNEDGGGGACMPVHETGRFALNGSTTLSPQDVHVVSRDSCQGARRVPPSP